MSCVDWLRRAAGAAASLSPTAPGAAPPPASVPIGRAKLTVGEARALAGVVAHVVSGSAGRADAEAVADAVIDVALSAANPLVAALVAPAADALAALVIERIASGAIRGDPDPIHDAQTQPSSITHGRWIGR
ncbi:hypothetical protein DFR50_14234 [Roseiarcus fermentans]|uniref:Uncharacterized protein n=1 Tax=Roseiarcus fermentans TaxID=1473586 RepID=A0A366EP85_9HYPH|nr:hypothetical protein [Roseiarcus fermentans]RBP03786.1 hypothetical protein DFR50_14234 [Roseiarcus fermentans]